MKRHSSTIVVASGVASIAALMIAGLPFQEGSSGPRANPRDADATAEATEVVQSAPSITVSQATTTTTRTTTTTTTSLPSSDGTTVAAQPPTSVTVAQAGPPPTTAATTTSPPPTDPGGAGAPTTVPPPQGYFLHIPSVDLHEPVVAGDQDEIDQGYVTAVDWSAGGYPTSCRPGDGCTVWLAGHRSTHQAVFARLPEVTAGSPIEIHVDGESFAYTVSDVVTVPGSSPPSVIHGDLVLQTSAPGGQRILVYAATVSSS